MKTKKQIIDSLFYEAFYFSQKTPVSEFEKYNEYAKNFAKSFNRLIKEIDDPVKRKEIIEWCITNDELLIIEIIATELKDYDQNLLKRNYGVLKNLFLNEISIIETAKKPITTLKDFFPTLQPQQINQLQNEFSKARGIEMACFIHQINKEGKLTIIKNTEKGFKNFLKMFGNIPENKHEAVRKCFNPAILSGDYDLINDNNLETYNTKDKITNALKVG